MEKHIYFLTIILVVLLVFFIFRYISRDFMEYKKLNPYLIEHTKKIGNGDNTIPGYMIRKSVDRLNGMEFTYAFWLNIDSLGKSDRFNIFKKGNDSPGVYIRRDSDNTMALEVDLNVWPSKNYCEQWNNNEDQCKQNLCKFDEDTNMCRNYKCSELNPSSDCYIPGSDEQDSDIVIHSSQPCCDTLDFCNIKDNKGEATCENKTKHTCRVNNLPINKWSHIIIMLVGNYLDVFVNGNLYERFEIKGIVHQDNDDLIIGSSPSANGSIMRLQYYNYAIPASKINRILSKTEITKDVKEYDDESTTDYLNRNYWIGQNVDEIKRKL